MCGIAGIILKNQSSIDIKNTVAAMAQAIAHRGPDGEGFMLATENETIPVQRGSSAQTFSQRHLSYVPKVKLEQAANRYQLAFAHRRLSILDLSDTGHQPMCSLNGQLWITFNGEIYNYIELRDELKKEGFNFISESDTEVILNAYMHWGTACVSRFNGMWAFCIYDAAEKMCFASRDRLGVKPFYYISTKDCFAFTSEQKAFVKAGLINASFNTGEVHNYLVNGLLETKAANFFEGVEELFPGENLIYSLAAAEVRKEKYYSINLTQVNESLSDSELVDRIESYLYNAVKMRLRSDVEVGACLSGGIDSSALCELMYKALGKSHYCFTSVFKNENFNEERYADLVAADIKARHFKTEPTLNGFLDEVDTLVYSQDVPIWDTSTYAQFKVMELAKRNNIKVVIDGQGADELFAGYHHHFVAKWNNLFAAGHSLEAIKDIKASRKTIGSPFVFYAKEKIKQKRNVNATVYSSFFKKEFISSHPVNNSSHYYNSVNEQLLDDTGVTRLKSFLKCEDRCGMWHSVESRTPFSDDVQLIDFMFSFDGNRKIQKGVSKHLLREATKKMLPAEIYNRYDKKGFETPMKKWVTELKPVMIEEIKDAGFEFINAGDLHKINNESLTQLRLLFKLFVLTRWKKVFA
jgi:asparagine synthase (glutamine-hydrolysing)